MEKRSQQPPPATPPKLPDRTPLPLLLNKTLYLATPFILLVSIVIASYYRSQVDSVEHHASTLNKYAVHDLYVTLEQLIRSVKGDAQLIANHPLLPSVLANPAGNESQQLTKEWISFSAQKRLYDQIRLLDRHGQELLRINLTPTGATQVAQKRLQNKADRYYFREAMTLAAGEVYLSPLDLNVENGQIEQPLKPMLRVAVPIADSQGNMAGLVVLNYLAANILADIDAHSTLADTQTLLLNQRGYYLRGFHPEDEWTFMFPSSTQNAGQFSVHYPQVWQQLGNSNSGQLNNEKGLFNYQWISTNSDEASPTPYDRRFILVSMISAERMATLTASYRTAAWMAVLLAIPTILFITALAARFRLRELHTLQRLRESEGHQRMILESVGEGILGLDAKGQLTFVNTRAAELTGFSPQEMMGNLLHNLIHASRNEHINHAPDECPVLGGLLDGHLRRADNDIFRRKDGDTFPVEYISNPIIKGGKVQGGVVSFFDITARKKAEQHIEHLVLYDALTDLPNKKLLVDRLSQQSATAKRTGQRAALLYIDIDRFKQVNDALGHHCGDEVLLEVARRLTAIAQEGDTVARISSDEFVLLRANVFSSAEETAHNAQLTADDIMLLMEQPFLLNGDPVRLTASIGITIFPAQNDDAATILSQADTAVSHAKEAGRNTTRFFTTEMERNTKDWLIIHNRLLEALANDAFTLVYQPKVQHDGKVVGLEALLRWNDEVLGAVSPAQFVPIAEQSGLIVQLSDFVLATACRQIKKWIDAGLGDAFGHVAVNISSAHFSEPNFVENIVGHIEHAGIPAQSLELEITERTLVVDISDTVQKVVALRERGIRFSIDDFGTGYSSLAYLQQLPLDRLKIDRAFVTHVYEDPDRQTIVEAIILLAKGLAIDVIAEGVETEEEMRYLIEAGCHEFQGYHFFRPMAVSDLTELLKGQTE